MSESRKAGAILSYVSIIVGTVLSFVYTPYLLKSLGQSEYGLYSLVNTVMGYLTILDFGLGNTIIRYTAKYRELGDKKKESSLYGMFLITYFIIGVIALIVGMVLIGNASSLFSGVLEKGQESKFLLMLTIAIINISLSFPLGIFSSILNGYEKYFLINLLGLVQKILTPLTMIGILFVGMGSVGLLAATTFITVAFNIIRLVLCIRKLKISVRFRGFEKSVFKEIVVYSFFIFLSTIIDKLFWSTDQIILSTVGTDIREVATYSLAATFVAAFITITSVLGHMYLPKFTRMVTNNASDAAISQEFIRVCRLQFFVCMLIFGGFIVIGERFIVELYAGKEYLDTYYITVIIMGALVTGITQNVGISVIQAKNKHRFRTFVQLAVAIANVGFSVIGVMYYGALGAAIVTFISHFFGIFFIMSIYYQKAIHLEITKLWKQLLKIMVAYMVLIGIFVLMNDMFLYKLPGLQYTIITGGVFVGAYVIVTYLFMNDSEKQMVKSVLAKFGLKKVRGAKDDAYSSSSN